MRPLVDTRYKVVVTSGGQTASATTKVWVEGDTDLPNALADQQEENTIDDNGVTHLMLNPVKVPDMDLASTRIAIYPNPSQGQFRISYVGAETGDAVVMISDFVGKPLSTTKLSINDLKTRQFDLSIYPKGVYLIVVRTANFVQTTKLIVQ